MNAGQFERLMAQLHRMREGQDLGLGAIRDELQRRDGTNAVMAALREVRDRLPVREVAEAPAERLQESLMDAQRSVWMREALQSVLEVLDGWIEGACENHGALGHRNEPVGDECWRTFRAADIRRMVNDTARELKIGEFPIPDNPREDTVVQ